MSIERLHQVMKIRVTMIEDSRETQIRFLQSVPLGVEIELQAITTDPFFDESIEKAIVEFSPNLIILDLRLSRDEASGFRVLRKLKESEALSGVPVVVSSKYIGRDSNDKNRKTALSYGAADALPKFPFPKLDDFLKYVKPIEIK